MTSSIAVCLVCCNEADRLPDALTSVQWADELLVMDLESADASADIARAQGARVIARPPVPIVEFVRNELAAYARSDWILVLDPDERISPALADELRRAASRDDIDAVVVPRMNHDLGYAPTNPSERYEPQLRMYRKAIVSWPEVPNALPMVPAERTHRVAARDDLVMLHDRSRNVPEIVDRIARYAVPQAQAMIDRGDVFTAQAMIRALGRRTWRQLVAGQAWRDGVPGLLRVGILVGFHFYVWVAFWQLSGGRRTSDDDRHVRRLGTGLEALRLIASIGAFPGRLLKRLFER